ncbi:prolylcarboxypeptidase-like protein [Citrus sinensis]|nr:prolylcarboxypeptidase-like protein [Citrus sinensis]
MRRRMTSKSNSHLPPEFVTYYYTQTLDHFNYKPESYATFQQKYIMNFKYWGGASTSSPIIVYIGEEAPLTFGVHGKGFIFYLASRFKAMLLYIEVTFQDANTLGFLSSTQALADCAQLITDVKRNLSAENCPVIAIGGSYGGMLASWLRLKYPHIAIGALASSAPILYFDDLTPQNGYHVVANDFRDVSESCYNTIKQSWSEIDRVAGQTNVLYYEDITPHNEYYSTVTKNYRVINPPMIDVSHSCRSFFFLFSFFHLHVEGVMWIFVQDTSETCYQNQTILESWAEIQRVGELPDGASILSKQFETRTPPRNENELSDALSAMYTSTSQYGPTACGNDILCKIATDLIINFALLHFYEKLQDIKLTLQRFTGNIIFSNGLRDPYSAGGVLKNISDSIIALPTVNGSHGLDIVKSNKTSDPDWLVQQRNTEVEIIEGWIAKYYADLKAINK